MTGSLIHGTLGAHVTRRRPHTPERAVFAKEKELNVGAHGRPHCAPVRGQRTAGGEEAASPPGSGSTLGPGAPRVSVPGPRQCQSPGPGVADSLHQPQLAARVCFLEATSLLSFHCHLHDKNGDLDEVVRAAKPKGLNSALGVSSSFLLKKTKRQKNECFDAKQSGAEGASAAALPASAPYCVNNGLKRAGSVADATRVEIRPLWCILKTPLPWDGVVSRFEGGDGLDALRSGPGPRLLTAVSPESLWGSHAPTSGNTLCVEN